MANIPRKDTPNFPDVYVLEETDPVTGGLDGIDNLPHKQLAERDEYLLRRVEPLEDQATQQEKRLQSVEISGSVSVGRAFPIWLAESDQGADFELFADAAYTWRDYAPSAIVATVAGDESVDVATTNNLVVGDAYVILDADGTTEVVEVEAILTATRFRATATLTKTRTDTGTLTRTSWEVHAGYALAGNGRYFSREIKTLRFDDAGRLIVRRTAGDGNVRVQVRRTNAPATDWTNALLKRSASTEDGFTDLEFRLPVGGTIELQVETQLGDSGNPIEIHYLVCLPEVRAGRADAVRKPTNVAPAEGAVDVMETPALTGDAYYSLYGIAHQAAEFEVATDADFANIVYQGSEATAANQHTVTSGVLATDQVYFWRCRYQDAEGTWSPWSKPTGFSTGAVFEYVAPPVISSPAADATGISLLPTISTADFEAVGTVDTHAASQYQVASEGTFASIVYDSGTVADLTSHQLSTALARETRYYVRVRHQGTGLGWSDWSVVRGFTTTNSADQPSITSPGDGATGVAFSDGLTVIASSFSFPGGGEAHVASDWEVRDAAAGTMIASSVDDGSNLTSWTVPGMTFEALTGYEVRVRYKGATTGYSPWSAWSSFKTMMPSGEAIFTATGEHQWIVPDGVTEVEAAVVSAGGGGGSRNSGGYGGYGGSGGGGGGFGSGMYTVIPGETITITVGKGGATAPYNTAARAETGGTSSFGSMLSVTGGVGGIWDADVKTAGGSPTGYNLVGYDGGRGGAANGGNDLGGGGGGAASPLGAGGEGLDQVNNGSGGDSPGGGRGAVSGNTSGGSGCGGGGASLAGQGGEDGKVAGNNHAPGQYAGNFGGGNGGGNYLNDTGYAGHGVVYLKWGQV